MDELQDRFEPITIAVGLACDGNRRGELNMIKKSKGFTWVSGAISYALLERRPPPRRALRCERTLKGRHRQSGFGSTLKAQMNRRKESTPVVLH
jgi:hypothetical protein